MKIMSFNLLCGGTGQRDWPCRKEMVVDTIRKEMPDSIGVQEAHINWMNVLKEGLPEYDYVGIGRDDGKEKGEFSAVFFKKEKYILRASGSFWLSETPDVPGKGWDAACIRICSWACLEEKESGKRFTHFNTHLDHIGHVAMQKGAELVTTRANEICGSMPAFFTGDFNVDPKSAPYKTVIASGFNDSRLACSETDNGMTFHWDVFVNPEPEESSIIDYCFFKGDIKPLRYRVIRDEYPGGLYPSDHFPVVFEFEM